MKVNKYLSTNFAFQTIYDDNAFAGFQSRQNIGIGVNYTFLFIDTLFLHHAWGVEVKSLAATKETAACNGWPDPDSKTVAFAPLQPIVGHAQINYL